jgi:hypothetical protein
MMSLRPRNGREGNRRELAMSIAEHLRELVLILTTLFEYEIDDSDVVVHMSNAKCAAERGLILSERLAALSTARPRKPH